MRIIAAYLFLLRGTAKFLSFSVVMGNGSPEGLMLMAGISEIIGGILLILGLFTCPATFILSGQMAVAYFMIHAAKSSALFPFANGGKSAVSFCPTLLHLVAADDDSLALDSLFDENKARCT